MFKVLFRRIKKLNRSGWRIEADRISVHISYPLEFPVTRSKTTFASLTDPNAEKYFTKLSSVTCEFTRVENGDLRNKTGE